MKGDLISRSALLSAMDGRYNEKNGKVPDNLAEGFMQMEKLIKEQPTAYDVEKVDEQILECFKKVMAIRNIVRDGGRE